jgi:hypothetical protein
MHVDEKQRMKWGIALSTLCIKYKNETKKATVLENNSALML